MSQIPTSSVLHQGIIPTGVRPGALFDVLLPDGSRIPVRCPPNRQPGDRFILRPYTVRIPEGVKKGKIFTVQANGRLFQVQCPRGKKAGDTILIRIPEFPEPPPPAPIDFEKFAPHEREYAPIVAKIPDFEVTPEYSEKILIVSEELDVPNDFICPITQELMLDPVIAVDGHSYERKAMESWLASHDTSPRTNEHLMSRVLIPNLSLRQRIRNFVETASASAATRTAASASICSTADSVCSTDESPITSPATATPADSPPASSQVLTV